MPRRAVCLPSSWRCRSRASGAASSCAILPEAPVEATARTLSWPLRSARRSAALGQLDLDRLRGAGGEVVARAAELRGWPCSPASLTRLGGAQRERAGAVAGRGRRAAHLDRRRAPAHLHRAAADGHRARRGVDGRRGVRLRRRVSRRMGLPFPACAVLSTFSKPSRMSSCAASATTESFPSPPRATSAVLSRTLTWSSPSSPETTSRPPPGVDRVVARPAEQRLRGAAAGQRVVARPARGGHRVGADVADGDRVVAAEAVGVQRLAGADVERERARGSCGRT